MYHEKTELLFPAYLIGELRDLRGPRWAELVDRVTAVEETHPDCLAFMLMMVELSVCLRCNSENYKFLQGCRICSGRTVRCFKGSDEELILRFEQALDRINRELPLLLHAPAHAVNGRRALVENGIE